MADDNLTFPWARSYDADQLAAFVEDLWGAASGDNDLETLDAIERVIAAHRPEPEPEEAPVECPLDARDIEVLVCLANGHTRLGAARKVSMSEDAVRALLARMYLRLGVQNAAHAVATAQHYRWLPTDKLNIPQPIVVQRMSPQAWKAHYRERAQQLRARPGEFVTVGPYFSFDGARRAVHRIQLGLLDDFRPAGSFEATAYTEAGLWAVRARYVGTASTPQKAVS
ncbi:LuxR C-terminal-related transcriptional regulator [Streptomyces cylindrosporus]|uniref:LuxR C-terminal-related transcriptional regulator n=1 Tax=Streptomyces cylindrosporus TaxID=2927583 RepID=A0ABS9YJN7_9ACTN|nr:LuxR C-terminal-related transcriptional regulator [Streptomyces cylindrosporus]MCI3277462.1 LuxR C-terminal-related transcriptional regulator [Streptomyces cylindrosporus]